MDRPPNIYRDEWTGWVRQAGHWIDILAIALLTAMPLLAIPVLLVRHWGKLVALWKWA